jgi:transcriptional antiterminator Rof (Rho-off)
MNHNKVWVKLNMNKQDYLEIAKTANNLEMTLSEHFILLLNMDIGQTYDKKAKNKIY